MLWRPRILCSYKGMAGGVSATVTIQAPPALCALLRVMINGQCIPALCTVLLSSGDYVECGGHGVCNISTQPNDSSDPMEVIVCVCDDLSYPIEKTCISKTCITTSPFLKSDFRIICSGHGV